MFTLSVTLFRSNDQYSVICTSTGGRPLSMSLTGPSGVLKDITKHMAGFGMIKGTGNDSFFADIFLEGGKNGDNYSCAASNIVSHSSIMFILQGIEFKFSVTNFMFINQ